MNSRKVLVTGAAGFIGAFLVKKLLEETDDVIVGLDNLNNYYDPGIKDARLRMLAEADPESRFTFVRGDLCDAALIERLFAENGFDVVVNLAAQAGVRYSIENPRAYLESNLVGFFNVLEACRRHPVRHLVYASSSSVYGGNKKVPFSEEDRVDSPVSLYAATKKSNELMAAAYSKLYSIPATGLRFFTVYGPMGRPDMAYFGFTEKLRRGETIKIFNMGDCRRDFTYVDDIVEGVRRVMESAPEVKMGEDGLPLAAHRVYNIGNSHPENLLDFVDTLQRVLVEEGVLPADYDFEAHKQLVPMQPGDVPVTYADTTALKRDLGYKPSTPLEDGLRAFAKWYKLYYERRKNYYKNQGRKREEIVTLSFLAQCMMSILLGRPDQARARPSTLLSDEVQYKKIFGQDGNLEAYYRAASLGKQVCLKFPQIKRDLEGSQISDIRFYVIMGVASMLSNKDSLTFGDIENLDLDKLSDEIIQTVADMVMDVYLALGGTSKAAKSYAMASKVKEKISLLLP